MNIGRRQDMRFRGSNVIDVDFDKEAIVEAIRKATSKEFEEALKRVKILTEMGNHHREFSICLSLRRSMTL